MWNEVRKVDGAIYPISAPKPVIDYYRWAGHETLIDPRWSLQRAFVSRKYYKAIFFGMMDMALNNAYVIYRDNKVNQGLHMPKREEFFELLQMQLLHHVTSDTFAS